MSIVDVNRGTEQVLATGAVMVVVDERVLRLANPAQHPPLRVSLPELVLLERIGQGPATVDDAVDAAVAAGGDQEKLPRSSST